ncbi:MAG: transglutaminase domain-containing protein, partial [Candidatus Omnitrophota bacterium]
LARMKAEFPSSVDITMGSHELEQLFRVKSPLVARFRECVENRFSPAAYDYLTEFLESLPVAAIAQIGGKKVLFTHAGLTENTGSEIALINASIGRDHDRLHGVLSKPESDIKAISKLLSRVGADIMVSGHFHYPRLADTFDKGERVTDDGLLRIFNLPDKKLRLIAIQKRDGITGYVRLNRRNIGMPDENTSLARVPLWTEELERHKREFFLPNGERAAIPFGDGLCNFADHMIMQTAREITRKCSTDAERIRAISAWVRDNLPYGIGYGGYWDAPASETIRNILRPGSGHQKMGMCFNMSNLQIAMARALGIRSEFGIIYVSRERFRDIVPQIIYAFMGDFTEHVFPRFFLRDEKKWAVADLLRTESGDIEIRDRHLVYPDDEPDRLVYAANIDDLALGKALKHVRKERDRAQRWAETRREERAGRQNLRVNAALSQI